MTARHVPIGSGNLRSRTWRIGLLLCALCVGTASHAGATVVVPATLDEVVDGSQLIVHGRVVSVRSDMTTDRRSIYTLITLAVDESLKGRPGPTVTFRVPNGQVGRYRRVVVGAPEFVVGDEVVVFLRAAAPAMPTLFGLSQGVYRIARGDASRQVASATFMRRVRALTATPVR